MPGHGPITDNRGVEAMRAYLVYIHDEARKRYDAGLSARDAAFDIALGDFESWGDSERIAINVDSLYREFSGDADDRTHMQELFTRMAELAEAPQALAPPNPNQGPTTEGRGNDGSGNPRERRPPWPRHRPDSASAAPGRC